MTAREQYKYAQTLFRWYQKTKQDAVTHHWLVIALTTCRADILMKAWQTL